jgi:hypothetical protein
MAAAGGLRANAPTFSLGGGGSAAPPPWLSLPKPTQRLPGALVPFLPQDNDAASEGAAEARALCACSCRAACR